MSSRVCGIAGTTARSSPTRRPAASSTPTRSARSTTRGGSSRSRARSTWRAARRGIRSSSRPAARRPGSNWRRAPPMSCSRSCRSWSRPRRPMPISRAAWRNTAARPTRSPCCPASCRSSAARDAEAREKLAKLQSWLTPTNAAVLVASRIGYDVSGHPLDGPVPPPPPSFEGGRTFYERAVRDGAAREHDLARPLQPDRGGARPLGRVRHAARRSPTRSKNGSSRARPTATTSCRPISPARSTISSIWSCRNAAPRPVPPGLRGHDIARSFRPAARLRPRPHRARLRRGVSAARRASPRALSGRS